MLTHVVKLLNTLKKIIDRYGSNASLAHFVKRST